MKISLTSSDESIVKTVESAITGVGCTLVRWSPDEGPAPDARLAIFDGLEALVLATSLDCYVLVLADEEELDLFAECPNEVNDFILKPLRVRELQCRVRELCNRISWTETVSYTHLTLPTITE
mgnify:CR=1 FL=1